ncbi:MAG TPA: hypothetical protein VF648_18575 [Pyrinomonadaceae bacterium]|jgi:hypothetical protein
MPETYIRIVGAAIIFLIVFFVTSIFPKFDKLTQSGNWHNGLPPVMALEFLSDPNDVGSIVKSEEARDDLKKAVEMDTWQIVPVYGILFLLLCLVLFFRTDSLFGQAAPYWAIVAVALTVGACAGDVIENNNTVTLLQKLRFANGSVITESVDPALIKTISLASHFKFALVFACAFILSFLFLQFPLKETGWSYGFQILSSLIFLSLILCSIVGLAGLFRHTLVPPAMKFLYLAGLAAAVCFLFAPRLYSR